MRKNVSIDAKLESQYASYSIPEGYHDGSGKVTASFSNLVAENIKDGVNIGGVVGTLKPSARSASGTIANNTLTYSSNTTLTLTKEFPITIPFTPSEVVFYCTNYLYIKNSGFAPKRVSVPIGGKIYPNPLNANGFLESGYNWNTLQISFNPTTSSIEIYTANRYSSDYNSNSLSNIFWVAY